MDEAVAGHATRIEVTLDPGNRLTISDNGPRHPGRRAPEISGQVSARGDPHHPPLGGKFSDKAYATSGGLHGVGVSVVNALSIDTVVEVARAKELWRQTYSRGHPTSALEKIGAAPNRRGTTIAFTPDAEIFGEGANFRPGRLYRLARSKAYLFAGVEIRWRCAPELINDGEGRAGRGSVPVSGWSGRSPQGAGGNARVRHQPLLHRQAGLSERARIGGMGGGLAAVERRRCLLLLQHHPDARRGHA
jgi:hypothetical protein